MDATVRRIEVVVFWNGMKKATRAFVVECSTCQKYKPSLSTYPGLFQPLPILDRVWSDVSIDFIEGLPKSEGKDVIMVVVDRLSKYAHFFTFTHPLLRCKQLKCTQIMCTNSMDLPQELCLIEIKSSLADFGLNFLNSQAQS